LVPFIIENVPSLVYEPILVPQTVDLIQQLHDQLNSTMKNQLSQNLRSQSDRNVFIDSVIKATTEADQLLFRTRKKIEA
jgi:hypothetical protein